MIAALRLLADALTLRTPPRALLYGLLNKLNYLSRTGNRRFEFERLYLEQEDPWNYRTSEYEERKYRHVLDVALGLRTGSARALEFGCSIGVFSRMLAGAFAEVTAVDLSREALAAAKRHCRGCGNLSFVRQDIRSLALPDRFDAIFCAEVLYYLPRKAAPGVLAMLERQLQPGGIVVLVSGRSTGGEGVLYFDDWKQLLPPRFQAVFDEAVDDPYRPYEVTVFTRAG